MPRLATLTAACIPRAPDVATLMERYVAYLRTGVIDGPPAPDMPVSYVRWVPLEKVVANDYNPNSVARNEMRLLHVSVKADGYTQPIVTVYDAERDIYVIVDGFHRSLVCRTYPDIAESTGGRVPVVVINKTINDRMASTVRHNRARGKHSVDGMASMVFQMLENGWDDAAVCNEMGLEAEELVRLKHITGFSKLFENAEYRKAWEMAKQMKMRMDYYKAHPGECPHEGKDSSGVCLVCRTATVAAQ